MNKKSELVGNYYGTIYLTVISLLQGIVLSQLVPNIITYSRLAVDPLTDIRLLPLVMTLIIIFIIWHHYAIGIFFLRWFPNIIDTTIPFIISIGQFFLLSYLTIETGTQDIQVRSWTTVYAIILSLGSFAYFGASWRLDASLFTNIMSIENAKIHRRISARYYGWAGVGVLAQGLFALVSVLLHQESWLYFSLVFLIAHLVISEYFLLRHVKQHFIQAIDEYDAIHYPMKKSTT